MAKRIITYGDHKGRVRARTTVKYYSSLSIIFLYSKNKEKLYWLSFYDKIDCMNK